MGCGFSAPGVKNRPGDAAAAANAAGTTAAAAAAAVSISTDPSRMLTPASSSNQLGSTGPGSQAVLLKRPSSRTSITAPTTSAAGAGPASYALHTGPRTTAASSGGVPADALHIEPRLHSLTSGCSLGWQPGALVGSMERTSYGLPAGGAGEVSVQQSGASFGNKGEDDALRVVALLQELLSLSSSLHRQPLAKSMALLLSRLPTDWICLTAVSSNARTQMQVAAAFSPEAQRQRGASGSAAFATPAIGSSSSSSNQVVPRPFRGMSGGPGGAGSILELLGGLPQPCAGSGSSVEAVVSSREAIALYAGDGQDESLPADWQQLARTRELKSFLAVPIMASGGNAQVIGVLSFGSVHYLDWSREWWMPSCQLICGWAAGALPQARAVLRVNFFDVLAQERDLDHVAALMVRQLPNVLVDEKLNPLEVRLALVSSKCTSAVIFTPPHSLPEEWLSRSGVQESFSTRPSAPGQVRASPTGTPVGSHTSSPAAWGSEERSLIPEGIILRGADESASSCSSCEAGALQPGTGPAGGGAITSGTAAGSAAKGGTGLVVVELSTHNTVLMSALEWGDVMVIKDTVQYFGRNVGLVQDLFMPSNAAASSSRKVQSSTLVLLPLIYKSRALGCIYITANWDINAALGKPVLAEVASQLAGALFKQLVRPSPLQAQWYDLLAEDSSRGVKDRGLSHSFRRRGASLDLQQPPRQHGTHPAAAGSAGGTAAAAAAAAATAAAALAKPAPVDDANSCELTSVDVSSRRTTSSVDLPASASSGGAAAAGAPGAAETPGLVAVGHSCQTELSYWPELLEVKEDVARGRNTAVYLAEYGGQPLAVKVFRYASGSDAMSSTGSGTAGNSSNLAIQDPELGSAMGCLYRLCHVHHPHVLQHVAVYPLAYEVVQRRSSRDPADTYLTAMVPRKDRYHRCCAVVTPFCTSGCLRDAGARGWLYRVLPTVAAHQQQHALQPSQSGSARSADELAGLAAMAPGSGGGGGVAAVQPVVQGLRIPYMPLLRVVLLQIALGMQYLHSHGIVHGELRAENVLIQGTLPLLPALPPAVIAAHQAALAEAGEPGLDLPDLEHQLSPAAVATAGGSPHTGANHGTGGGSPALAAPGADSLMEGFSLKVKDIGLCSLSNQGRTLTVKKLVGRTRVHAASWLPPECFRGEALSKSSDVYAFGILMWELYTGQVAFSNLFHTPPKVLQTIICDGVRPAFPRDAPEWYTSLAARCWHPSLKHRPSFRRVVAQLQAMEGRLEAAWGPGL